MFDQQSLQSQAESIQALNNLINQAGDQLQDQFNKREDELLLIYKAEMLKVQRQLKQLSEDSNESEIRRRIQEHREKLIQQRDLYIKQSLQLSNQIKKLKEQPREIQKSQEELLSEIKFLDEQLIYAEKHNYILQEELESLQEDYYNKPVVQLEIRKKTSLPQIKSLQSEISKEQRINEQIRQQLILQEEDEFEKCFEDAIASLNQSDASTTLDLTSCENFSDIQKRKIFEEFLNQHIVKQKIYEYLIK